MPAPATLPQVSVRPSYASCLRHAIHELATASSALQSLFGRVDRLAVLSHAISLAELPIIAFQVVGDERVGGIGDRRRATVILASLAEGNDGPDVAEAAIAVLRELLTPTRLEAFGLGGVVLVPSEDDGDGFDVRDVPAQVGRAQLALSITATVEAL